MTSEEIAVMLEEALRLCQTGALTEAEQIYRQVIEADPATPDAWNNLALICYQQDRLDSAAEAAERATGLRPHIPQYWLVRGNIELAQSRNDAAQESFSRAIELAPDFAEAHYRRALGYHREYKVALSIAAYREALRLAPDVAEIHFQLAEALTLDNQWVEAMHAYEQAFARDPAGDLDRRGCLDSLRYMHWDSLPEFWVAEIKRFFARDDIDKTRYVSIGLRALRAKSTFKKVLAAARHPQADFAPDAAALQEVMRDELLQLLLSDALVVDAELEVFLTRLRAALLFDGALRRAAPLDFICTLALQCFNNEFVFGESPAESARIAELQGEVEAALLAGNALQEPAVRLLAVCAMYRPLPALRGARGLLAAPTPERPALERLVRRAVLNTETERELRQGIRSVGGITDEVSLAVRDMYEEHPYPRWFGCDRWPPLAFAQWLENEVPMLKARAEFPAPVRILVAGCGTGQDAIWLAGDITGAEVLAVDLSRASLAYAQRMANELGVSNLEFRQGDILGLGVLTQRFDMIYSKGVLHHLQDPRAGLRVLAQLLRPGGLLKIGLYSERARASVNAARDLVRERQLPSTETAIRDFRQYVLGLGEESVLKRLCSFRDFYSMSMCRDWLMHVQEHQFRLPQIRAMLDEAGLTVLGLSDVPRHALANFRGMFPGDDAMTNFDHWDAFEALHREAFLQMYQVWCRRPDGEPGQGDDAP